MHVRLFQNKLGQNPWLKGENIIKIRIYLEINDNKNTTSQKKRTIKTFGIILTSAKKIDRKYIIIEINILEKKANNKLQQSRRNIIRYQQKLTEQINVFLKKRQNSRRWLFEKKIK